MGDDEAAKRSEKCTARAVEACTEGHRVWAWFPQLGGYCGHSHADFDSVTNCGGGGPGCFELTVYHDGRFPQDEPTMSFHCCDALQFVEFGLDVFEAQVRLQKREGGEPVKLPEKIVTVFKRIVELTNG